MTQSASRRKPYNDRPGYVASLRSGANRGWVVIYLTAEQQMDVEAGKYMTVCEQHSLMSYHPSLPKARADLKDPTAFCPECRAVSEGQAA